MGRKKESADNIPSPGKDECGIKKVLPPGESLEDLRLVSFSPICSTCVSSCSTSQLFTPGRSLYEPCNIFDRQLVFLTSAFQLQLCILLQGYVKTPPAFIQTAFHVPTVSVTPGPNRHTKTPRSKHSTLDTTCFESHG